MGLLEVLTIVFVVLKLVGVITWSWWAVFTPVYVALAIYVILLIAIAVINRDIPKNLR